MPLDPVAEQQAQFDAAFNEASAPYDYNTPLTPEENIAYAAWKQKHAPKDSGYDYDLQGAFKAGIKPDPKTGHWPDTFKKPNHPTFITESKYAPLAPHLAGSWGGPNKDQYVPPAPVVAPEQTFGF